MNLAKKVLFFTGSALTLMANQATAYDFCGPEDIIPAHTIVSKIEYDTIKTYHDGKLISTENNQTSNSGRKVIMYFNKNHEPLGIVQNLRTYQTRDLFISALECEAEKRILPGEKQKKLYIFARQMYDLIVQNNIKE
jgi:hypothetical protein